MPDIDRNKRKRRSYSNKFKAEVVAHCLAGDESIASISMPHDINQNLVHRWVTEHRRYGKHDLSQFDEPKNKLPGPICRSSTTLSDLPSIRLAVFPFLSFHIF